MTPYERMFIHNRHSCTGGSVPSWLSEAGKVLMKVPTWENKYQPLVQELDPLKVNPNYANVRLPDRREASVSLRHLVPRGQEVEPVVEKSTSSEILDQESIENSLDDEKKTINTLPENKPRNSISDCPAEMLSTCRGTGCHLHFCDGKPDTTVSGFVLIIVGVNGVDVGCNGCDLTEFLGSKPVMASRITIVSGIMIIVIPFLGCWGALKENSCMVKRFGVLLFVAFVVETTGGSMAYSYGHQFSNCRKLTENILRKNMNYSIAQQKVDSQKIWDEMQQKLKCCGVTGRENYLFNNITIPASCFNQNETYGGEQRFTADKAHKPGCYEVLVNKIKDKLSMVASAANGIAILEILGWRITLNVFFAIKRKKQM